MGWIPRKTTSAYDGRVDRFSFRRFFLAQIAFVVVLTIGTLGFVALTDEGWTSSFYRSVVTTTLTGLDSKPEGAQAWQSSSTLRALWSS
jgi:hypothetical protein